MEIGKLRDELKAKVKNYYTNCVMLKAYSGPRQRNVDGGRDSDAADKTAMDSDINGWLADIVVIESDVDALADTEMYDNFTTGSDSAMKGFVAGYLGSLTNDTQKLAVVVAIQNIGA